MEEKLNETVKNDQAQEMSELKSHNILSRPQSKKSIYRHLFLAVVMFGFFSGFLGAMAAIYSLGGNISMSGNNRQTKVLLQEGEIIAEVAEKLSPSVVSINTSSSREDQIFGIQEDQQGAGTGVVLNTDGVIVTNRHVVPDNTTAITIIDSKGRIYEDVEVIDRDSVNDIAFLKVNKANNLKPATLGNSSKVKIGNRVIAIGNALGLFNNTVTSGIISGISRPITANSPDGAESLDNLLQTDASINPGNSGGPLVSIEGEVIGINTAIAGNAENIGFAIPIDDIKPLYASVLDNGEIIRSYLGVRYVPVTESVIKEFDLKVKKGALIIAANNAVLPGSPADKADIRKGDVITSIGDKVIDENVNLSTIISQYQVGQKLSIELNRRGQELTKTVTLEASQL